MNDFLTVRLNGNEISMMKLNGTIIYQKGTIPEPEIPKYVVGEFYNNTKITEVKTMVDSSHTNLKNMFYGCYSLESVNTTDWDTSNVTEMENMFQHCISLTTLDLSNFDTSKVTNMGGMFYNCFNLEVLDIRNFKAPSLGQTDNMFDGCNKLRVIRMDYCDNRTLRRLIANQDGFPIEEIGVDRVIYCRQSNLTDSFGSTITAPSGWRFVYVD